jgi:hypothetical protein
MPCQSHPPSRSHSYYIWRTIQVMMILIMKFFPAYYVISLSLSPSSHCCQVFHLCSSLISEIKFYTHTKLRSKL